MRFKMKIFIINLDRRVDRKIHSLEQFSGKDEFDVSFVSAIEHLSGALGLWETIRYIIENMVSNQDQFIILCEDDHEFTNFYNKEDLCRGIIAAKEKKADILLGGVSWFQTAIQISPQLFWTESFTGLQFTVIFRKFFDVILTSDFDDQDAADRKISSLTDDKFLFYPFLSIQREFGYSDVTFRNNSLGRVNSLFASSSEKLGQLRRVTEYYKKRI